MHFKDLAQYFEKIEQTSSRLTITELLSSLLKQTSADEVDKTIYLLQGRVTPLYVRKDFGVAEKMVLRSIASALQLEPSEVDKVYKRTGDVGLTATELRRVHTSLYQKNLSVLEVYESLYKITETTGPGSQEVKIQLLSELIQSLDAVSVKYVVRLPIGVLRLGFSDMTVLDSLSWMLKGNKELRPQLEKAYHVHPDLGHIAQTLKKYGIEGVTKIHPALFTPILMMRAERLSSPSEIIEKLGKAAIEPKYDGFRLQVHYKKGKKNEVKLYSRNLDDVTYMYPDIVEGVQKDITADEIILEGEAIGYEPVSGNFLPFQETVQRKRKHGIQEKLKEIPLKLFAFEVLYINGESLINTLYKDRRSLLEKHVKKSKIKEEQSIMVAPELVVDNKKDLELQFDDAVTKGLEGIMAKKLEGVYQPGARGSNWIKYKRSYSAKINDTLDCLVMGYDLGKGKRTGFGIGAFLVGVYDEKDDIFKTVAKIGTGLTDEEWRSLHAKAEKLKTDHKPPLYDVDKMMATDVWVKPEIVVEIKADEITRSPVHTAGRILKPSKSGSAFDVDIPGYALRFPRLVRFRDDKRKDETTTVEEIEKIIK